MYEKCVEKYGDILTDWITTDIKMTTLKIKGLKVFMELSKLCKKYSWNEEKLINDMRKYIVTKIKES